jgi:hypothetical protein
VRHLALAALLVLASLSASGCDVVLPNHSPDDAMGASMAASS